MIRFICRGVVGEKIKQIVTEAPKLSFMALVGYAASGANGAIDDGDNECLQNMESRFTTLKPLIEIKQKDYSYLEGNVRID